MDESTSIAEQIADLHRLISSGEARDIRERTGVTQANIADSIGTTPGAISRWESGARAPRGNRALQYRALLRRLATGVSS